VIRRRSRSRKYGAWSWTTIGTGKGREDGEVCCKRRKRFFVHFPELTKHCCPDAHATTDVAYIFSAYPARFDAQRSEKPEI